jgi:hypothetical protein
MRSGCPICGDELIYIDLSTYPYEVCSDCDKKAVNEDGQKARSDPKGDWGESSLRGWREVLATVQVRWMGNHEGYA